ncbi:MAG TPA: molybdopterin-synthase adenylyltransferase MoeB [Myxococcota bacterium]|nr:molybdopterin-synthase adenylyltransferase MoeB [Myxococcota bacterium]
MSRLSSEQLERYKRHLLLAGVGPAGQEKLLASSALLLGAGGLGSPAALYLAAAGVGRIGLCDFDRVDLSNLQRQVLYGSSDVGAPKTEVAARRLHELNPDVEVVVHETRLDASNAREIFAGYDVVLDGTDTFPSRYLASDVCVWLKKPLVSGSVMRFEGQVAVFDTRSGPCYRCLFPEPPPPELAPNCAEAGVLGVLPGLVGVIQATELLKLLLGIGEPLVGRLLVYDALTMEFKTFRIPKDPRCAVCGPRPTITEPIDYAAFCAGSGAGQPAVPEIGPRALAERLSAGQELLLLDVREPFEAEIASIPGARLVPLGELEGRLGELDPWRTRDVVVHCRSGGRSRRACDLLRSKGFESVSNLAGGIEAWAREVDPEMKRY